jgi:adenylate cyclase, class 2
MSYEVEVKFPLPDADAMRERLRKLGAAFLGNENQVDRYFNHPARDFARTDEALRTRYDSSGTTLTYKGPKIDALTKTRRELEVDLTGGESAVDGLVDVLLALGFNEIRVVAKTRQMLSLDWHGTSIEVSIDDVCGLGSFIELECVCGADEVERTRALVLQVARELGLAESERRSYLEMLLTQAK